MAKQGSRSGSLAKSDLEKIVTGAAVAASGALLAYCADTVIPWLQENPKFSLVLAPMLAVMVNALRKWLSDTRVVVLLLGLLLSGATATGASRPSRSAIRGKRVTEW